MVTLVKNDLEFILKQIQIAEAHADPANTRSLLELVGGSPLLPNGLRTVDGSYNNLVPGRELWGAADQPMPRLLAPNFTNDADGDAMYFGPPLPGVPAPVTNTNYANGGNVADADPRIISNLIVDQTIGNPAAVEAWFDNALAVAAWEEANPGKVPLRPGDEMVANGQYITNADLAFLPNIAPDEGISAPFNAWMTFFGQFFDHGLDLITKGNNGTVFIPLQADDPLVLGADGTAGTADDLPAQLRFMVLTRATPVAGAGADGVTGTADDTVEHVNTTTPFVDQNQTYTSHASHQVFLREYKLDASGRPLATGHLLDGKNPDGSKGGLPTWGDVKAQAREVLGIELTDGDVLNLPLLRTDPYGEFIRGPNGMPQLILGIGADGIPNTADDVVVEGSRAAPVGTFTPVTLGGVTYPGAIRTGHAFLDDIANAANPFNSQTGGLKQADSDSALGRSEAGTYDNELLDRHFVTGDGRGNENIGLTAVHHIFHSEHNRQVEAIKLTVLRSGDADFINAWLSAPLAGGIAGIPTDPAALAAFAATLDWDGERLFQAGRFATEMQYQHLVFEEFGRKIQPAIDPFVFNNVTDINPAIFAEFANTVYRFGHSMLTDTVNRIFLKADGTPAVDQDWSSPADIGLIEAFLNPLEFDKGGTITHDQAAGAIVRGMTIAQGNAIDEFVVGALRNNLLGLPLDLPALNIARGRDTGMPTLNEARQQLYAASGSSFLKPYESWLDFAQGLKNPASVVNFLAAYGTHASIAGATTLEAKRDAAMALVFGGEGAPGDRIAFLTGTGGWNAASSGLNSIDLWIGGLAEKILLFGGMLGSTFNAIFELQMENLQDADRFYYLSRTQGLNFLNELENNSFSKLIMKNTDLSLPGADGIRGTADDVTPHHIGVDSFAKYDFVLELNKAQQIGSDPVGLNAFLEAMGLGKVQRDNLATAADERATSTYLKFTGAEHVVIGGTEGNDTIIGDLGDDGLWGGGGDDRIEAGQGVDLVLGGNGDDIITDEGDTGDFLKGEAGDDVIANSNGIDILMGGPGKDAVFVGVDDTEVFGGLGDDFILGGDGVDLLMGNEGDDWIEAGPGFDTTAGDNSQLFFNSNIIGHDVMFAGSEEHDFDAESGDDIMVQGESVMRNEGMFGFDWAIFKGARIDGYADMRIKIFTTDQLDILRNRFDKVEALSGWTGKDTLIGDDRVSDPTAVPGTVGDAEGIFDRDGLDQAGIDRISGLGEIVRIPDGGLFFEHGNILLGGAGSDTLQGNGGDDILDGDRWLNVRIRITGNGEANTAENEIATVDSMKHVFTLNPADPDAFPAAWAGKSLFELMVERVIRPNQLHIVREVLVSATADVDVARFSGNRAEYAIEREEDGSFTISHVGGTTLDGVDTLRNVEHAVFADGRVVLINTAATASLTVSDTTPTEGQALTATLGPVTDPDGVPATGFTYQWQALTGAGWVGIPGADAATFTPTGAQAGQQLRAVVTFTDLGGTQETVISAATTVAGRNYTGSAGADTFNGTAGSDSAFGGNGADTLNGAEGSDTLLGGDGNDLLNGGAGADSMAGGNGNDIYVVDSAADIVTEAPGQGTDLVRTTLGSYSLGAELENLAFVGTGAFNGTGNDLANLLTGGGGNDTLNGGTGNDTLNGNAGDDRLVGGTGADSMSGGTGNDTYVVGEAGDAVVENAGAGTDTVETTLASYTLGANLETLSFTGLGAFTGTGNDLANLMNGGGGHDLLLGGGGVDTLHGGGGNDTLDGGFSADVVTGGEGDDQITGGNGNDTLTGGGGNDLFLGAIGNDTYLFGAGFGHDTIQQFNAGGGSQDRLDLTGLGITAESFAANVLITQEVGGTLVTVGGGTITLVGVVATALTAAGDFILA